MIITEWKLIGQSASSQKTRMVPAFKGPLLADFWTESVLVCSTLPEHRKMMAPSGVMAGPHRASPVQYRRGKSKPIAKSQFLNYLKKLMKTIASLFFLLALSCSSLAFKQGIYSTTTSVTYKMENTALKAPSVKGFASVTTLHFYMWNIPPGDSNFFGQPLRSDATISPEGVVTLHDPISDRNFTGTFKQSGKTIVFTFVSPDDEDAKTTITMRYLRPISP